MITVHSESATSFNNNGYGILYEVIDPLITCQVNGDYSLELSTPVHGKMSQYLIEGNQLNANIWDGSQQVFRIKRVTKDFKLLHVYAQHKFYDLLDNFISNCAPTNLNCTAFGLWVLDHTNFSTPFTFTSDITNTASARYVRRNPVECFIGSESNSMANLFGGEIVRDNYSIALNTRMGSDRGVKLLVGKNITSIQIVADITTLATRIVPVGFDGLTLPEIYVDSPLIDNYPTPKVAKVDFNDIKYDPESEDGYGDVEDAYTALRDAANSLFTAGIDLPKMNIKVDWLELSKVEQYRHQFQDLERVWIGDTVTVELLGISYQTEVVKITYNPMTDMIQTFELGTIAPTIGSAINNAGREIENRITTSLLEAARDNATEIMNSALGGYVYKTDSELYIMDAPTPEEAVRLWRWNINGLAYSSTGINGTYETAITMDGQIVADFITVGTIQTSMIQGIDQIVMRIDSNEAAINEFHTYFAFGENGLTIGKEGSEYTNVLDDRGMTVLNQGNAVLTANNDGVGANAFVVDSKWQIDTLDNSGYVLGFWRR